MAAPQLPCLPAEPVGLPGPAIEEGLRACDQICQRAAGQSSGGGIAAS